MKPVRALIVFLHRWVGLALAAFLLIEGLTGSILAFEGPIGDWLDPASAHTTLRPDLPTLDLASLAIQGERVEPRVQVAYFKSIGPDIAILRVLPRIDPATQKPYAVDFTDVVLDARTGADLGRLPPQGDEVRRAGSGSTVMPFIKRLHYNLAIGEPGAWLFYVVALLWTLDTLYSVVLTLPQSFARFWNRWKPAWLVKTSASAYRVTLDLHRAGGLWCFILLFVFAWSSVQLEDQWDTFDTVMGGIFRDYRPIGEALTQWPHHDASPLKLDWRAAQARGEVLMQRRAQAQGFHILAPVSLVHLIDNGVYNYEVRTDRHFPDHVQEVVFFDGDTGEELQLPGLEYHLGNAVGDWIRALHMAVDPLDNSVYRTLVCAFGLVLTMLSVTGVLVWLRKWRARHPAARAAR